MSKHAKPDRFLEDAAIDLQSAASNLLSYVDSNDPEDPFVIYCRKKAKACYTVADKLSPPDDEFKDGKVVPIWKSRNE